MKKERSVSDLTDSVDSTAIAKDYDDYIDPVKFARSGRIYSVSFDLSELSRLQSHLCPTEKNMKINAEFRFSMSGRVSESRDDFSGVSSFSSSSTSLVLIQLDVRGVVPLICQRCLGLFEYLVCSKRILSPVRASLEIENLPEEIDPVWLENDLISPKFLVEEEILLALPWVPMHEESVCVGLSVEAVVF